MRNFRRYGETFLSGARFPRFPSTSTALCERDAEGVREAEYERAFPWRSGSRKACHRQIIRRETRCSAWFLPVSILRSLPTLRTIWFIHRCWLQLILVRAQVKPCRCTGERTSLHCRACTLSRSFRCIRVWGPNVRSPHMHGQTGRAGDFWSIDDRRPRSS